MFLERISNNCVTTFFFFLELSEGLLTIFFFLREFSMEMAASGGPLIQRSAKNSRHAFSLTR